MRLLLVGSGGREHALAWKLAHDDPTLELIAAPGNPGIAAHARCVAVNAGDVDALVTLARDARVDAVIVGPEAPLAAGLVDRLRAARIPAFGPTAAAARIETSKAFAKALMTRAGVPTARAEMHTEPAAAKRAAHAFGAPVVVKASGLAAGKGVIVCLTLDEAERAIDHILGGAFGAAGHEVLVEEFMEGEELSLFALTDGEVAVPMLSAQDHKRLLEGDAGPNTGGMGAYAPVSIATTEVLRQVHERVLAPTLAALREAGTPFTGLLYAGLMLTARGPRVVEFNCRFGDPETQAILPLMAGSLLDPLLAIARGDRLDTTPLAWHPAHAVTTVVAAAGYPEQARAGDAITLPPVQDDVHVFQAGTTLDGDGLLRTAGGRVLAVTALAATLDEARRRSREGAAAVAFAGRQFRGDIAWREAARTGAAAGDAPDAEARARAGAA
jgi:phosphoribosylamine--glycine ligase